MISKLFRRAVLSGAVVILGGGAVLAAPVNQIDGLALKGFDPVAYFTDHKAVKGSPELTAQYDGVTYEFASPAHRDAFIAEPVKYVPQYGGFCAFANAEENLKADIDPHAFAVNHGKLYVNFSEEARDAFQLNVDADIAKGDQNWPGVAQQTKIIR